MATTTGSDLTSSTARTRRPADVDSSAWPRLINIALGVWLFISAFVWPHTASAMTNTWILGVIITLVAVTSLFVPAARWVNVGAAIWLFFSTFAIHHVAAATVWNNVIVAILVFIFALTPTGGLAATTGNRHRMAPA